MEVPRNGLHMLDLRRPHIDEVSNDHLIEGLDKFRDQMADPFEVRHQRLISGKGLVLGRTDVWAGDTLVADTFSDEDADLLVRRYRKVRRARRTNSVKKVPGHLLFFQKPAFKNYFHWMAEGLPRLSVLNDPDIMAQLDGVILRFGAKRVPKYVSESLELFFPHLLDKIVCLNAPEIEAERLAFFTDRGLDRAAKTRMYHAAADFLDSLKKPDTPGDEVVFISRSNMPRRRLVNEDALIDHLSKRFKVSVFFGDKMTVAEQAAALGKAHTVIGVHGAGLTNVIFAPRGAKLIEINSMQYLRRTRSFHDSALLAGVKPYLALGEYLGDSPRITNDTGGDIFIDPQYFDRVSELVSA